MLLPVGLNRVHRNDAEHILHLEDGQVKRLRGAGTNVAAIGTSLATRAGRKILAGIEKSTGSQT